MKSKAILALAILLPCIAIAAQAASLKPEPAQPAPAQALKELFPYPYGDFPQVLTFKGIAVADNRVVPAALIAVQDAQSRLGYAIYLLIDGQAHSLLLTDITHDSQSGALLLDIRSGREKGRLILKAYTIEWRQTALLSGTFGDYLLNMRSMTQEPINIIAARHASGVDMISSKASNRQIENEASNPTMPVAESKNPE